MVREAEGEHAGVTEGDIPGTRRRRARVEKRVRAAHYARDTSRSSDAKGARGARVELKRDRKRIVVARRQEKERKIIERRGRKSARARDRDEGAQREKERGTPGKAGERALCRRHRPPRSSARAAVDVFCEGKPPSCESASGDRCTLGTLKRSACERKKREREREGKGEE